MVRNPFMWLLPMQPYLSLPEPDIRSHRLMVCNPNIDCDFCGLPGFHRVMEGIDKAIQMGYDPVKVSPHSTSSFRTEECQKRPA